MYMWAGAVELWAAAPGPGAAPAVERHETRSHSQIWCFGTQHWDTRGRQSKSSARRTRCCRSGTAARGLVPGGIWGRAAAGAAAGTAAAGLPWCDRGAREALSARLGRCNHRPRPCTRASHTPFQLGPATGVTRRTSHVARRTAPGRGQRACAAAPARVPGSREASRPTRSRRGSLAYLPGLQQARHHLAAPREPEDGPSSVGHVRPAEVMALFVSACLLVPLRTLDLPLSEYCRCALAFFLLRLHQTRDRSFSDTFRVGTRVHYLVSSARGSPPLPSRAPSHRPAPAQTDRQTEHGGEAGEVGQRTGA